MVEMTPAQLAARLMHHADISEAFGKTSEGQDMRLAASVLIEFENLVNGSLDHLKSEVRRLELELAGRAV